MNFRAEVPEEDYRDYPGSLVTYRNKLIELPAEALGGVGGGCTNSLMREKLKKNLEFIFNFSLILADVF